MLDRNSVIKKIPVLEDGLTPEAQVQLRRRFQIRDEINKLLAEDDAVTIKYNEIRNQQHVKFEKVVVSTAAEECLRKTFQEVGIGLDPMDPDSMKDLRVGAEHVNPLGGPLNVNGIVVTGPRIRLTLTNFTGIISIPVGLREQVGALQSEVKELQALADVAYGFQDSVDEMLHGEKAKVLNCGRAEIQRRYSEMRARRMQPADDICAVDGPVFRSEPPAASDGEALIGVGIGNCKGK